MINCHLGVFLCSFCCACFVLMLLYDINILWCMMCILGDNVGLVWFIILCCGCIGEYWGGVRWRLVFAFRLVGGRRDWDITGMGGCCGGWWGWFSCGRGYAGKIMLTFVHWNSHGHFLVHNLVSLHMLTNALILLFYSYFTFYNLFSPKFNKLESFTEPQEKTLPIENDKLIHYWSLLF